MIGKQGEIVLYPAAALFCGRETFFNIHLVNRLEEQKGYKTLLPQRDGFVFGALAEALIDNLPAADVPSAIKDIIYLLDVGLFIPKAHVVIVNFDEPIDEGAVVEAVYAKLMGKYVIGFRTDIRSPYGEVLDQFGGMNFFPAYQCDVFIRHYMLARHVGEANNELDVLVEKIDRYIKKASNTLVGSVTNEALALPHIANIIKAANLLFAKIKDIHSKEGMKEIIRRYQNHKNILEKLKPRGVL